MSEPVDLSRIKSDLERAKQQLYRACPPGSEGGYIQDVLETHVPALIAALEALISVTAQGLPPGFVSQMPPPHTHHIPLLGMSGLPSVVTHDPQGLGKVHQHEITYTHNDLRPLSFRMPDGTSIHLLNKDSLRMIFDCVVAETHPGPGPGILACLSPDGIVHDAPFSGRMKLEGWLVEPHPSQNLTVQTHEYSGVVEVDQAQWDAMAMAGAGMLDRTVFLGAGKLARDAYARGWLTREQVERALDANEDEQIDQAVEKQIKPTKSLARKPTIPRERVISLLQEGVDPDFIPEE